MNAQLYTAPVLEPITLIELADHLRIDTTTLSESLTPYTCIAAGSHPVTTGYTLLGTGIDVLGKDAIVYLRPVNNGAGATVDCKIQESDDNVSANYTDWTGGAFTTITEANDTTIQEKQYTGTKQWIRTVSQTLVNACEFGTDILVKSADAVLSDDLTDLITDAREEVERHTRRGLLTQTWDYYLQAWPSSDRFRIPFGNLQSVTHLKWTDTDGTETTLTENTDYLVETNGEDCGFIVLPYGISWPSGSLYPSNPIKVRFVCGWTTAASIPKNIKRAVKFYAEKSYYRGARDKELQPVIDGLLGTYRLPWEF